MAYESVHIIERVFKAAIFVPIMAVIAWWLLANWLDRTLAARDALIGFALLAVAALLGLALIVRGGWGILGLLAFIYSAVLAAACWNYVGWRRRERDDLLRQVKTYQDAIGRDPNNAAAYSFLGEAHLKLRNFGEAVEALERALELDHTSKRDRRLLQQARRGQPLAKWRRLD